MSRRYNAFKPVTPYLYPYVYSFTSKRHVTSFQFWDVFAQHCPYFGFPKISSAVTASVSSCFMGAFRSFLQLPRLSPYIGTCNDRRNIGNLACDNFLLLCNLGCEFACDFRLAFAIFCLGHKDIRFPYYILWIYYSTVKLRNQECAMC